MLKSITGFFRRYPYEITIVLVMIMLYITNYPTDGKYLTGWDSLQTELHPWLAVKRAFFSVWQEYQSFGLLSAMGHGADLIRAVFDALLSAVLPQHLVRYTFHMLMILTGVFGSYRLLVSLGFDHTKRKLAFLGSLFYLLNFGTIQLLYLPYEAFSICYAFMPWQIWSFLQMMHAGSKIKQSGYTELKHQSLAKTTLTFAIVNVLATPYAYIQTLFVVYAIVLGLLSTGLVLRNRTATTIKRVLLAFFIVTLTNAFWLIPESYFVKKNGHVVSEAKMNQLATEDTYFQNREKGTVKYFLPMQGLYYDLYDTSGHPLFETWKTHFSGFMGYLPYVTAVIAIVGLLYVSPYQVPFALLYIFIAVLFLNATPPFEYINILLRKSSFLSQIFRSPFTKFVIPYALVSAYMLAAGTALLADVLKKMWPSKSRITRHAVLVAVAAIVIAAGYPVAGHLFSNTMKVSYPEEYMKLFAYFRTVDTDKRIALLPDYTFWGWFVTRWGYVGSGFVWYGIEQPIASRTFDPWSNKSENYFWELKAAIDAENLTRLENVLRKYDISYLVLDTSLLPVSGTLKGIQYDRIQHMLADSKHITLQKKWQYLSIYSFDQGKPETKFVSVATTLPNIGPAVKTMNLDTGYENVGTYKTDVTKPMEQYYPFMDFFTQTQIQGKHWSVHETADQFIFERELDFDPSSYKLVASATGENDFIYQSDLFLQYKNIMDVSVEGRKLIVKAKKTLVKSLDPTKTQVLDCGVRPGTMKYETKNKQLMVTAIGGSKPCFGYNGLFLEQQDGYVLKIENTNMEGRRLFFYITDETKKNTYIEDRLGSDITYHILHPDFAYGLGYSFNFQDDSYTNMRSTNIIKGIKVYLIPFKRIKSIRFVRRDGRVSQSSLVNVSGVTHPAYHRYEVDVERNQGSLLLNQEYSDGWAAFQIDKTNIVQRALPSIFGRRLEAHYMVNNWANGWDLPPGHTATIAIIYMPQYLQYGGLIITMATITYLITFNKRRNNNKKH